MTATPPGVCHHDPLDTCPRCVPQRHATPEPSCNTRQDYLDAIQRAYPGPWANGADDQVWNSIAPLIADDISDAYDDGFHDGADGR